MNLKDFIKSKNTKEQKPKEDLDSKQNFVPEIFSFINEMGSDIEDKKDSEQKQEFEDLGALKCLSKIEEKVNNSLRSYAENTTGKEILALSDFVKKMNIFMSELRKQYVDDYTKRQIRKEVLFEVVSYLNNKSKKENKS